MKKLLSLLLCIACLSTAAVPVMAEEAEATSTVTSTETVTTSDDAAEETSEDAVEADYKTTKAYKNFNKLRAFGILEGYTDAAYEQNAVITRAELAKMIAKIINFDLETGEVGGVAFADVKPGDSFYEPITYLKNTGVIAGREEDYYYGQENAKINEVARLLVDIMGFQQAAVQGGGYPNGYLKAAAAAGIKLNAINKDAITLQEISAILWTAATNGVCLPGSISSSGISVSVDPDRTILTEYMGIYNTKGLVESNRYTALIGKNKANEGDVYIDGKRFLDPKDVAIDFLGYNVEYYYRDNEDKAERELLYAEPLSTVKVVEVGDEDVLFTSSSFTQFNFVYADENGRTKQIALPSNVNVIYNNEQLYNFTKNTFDVQTGNIKLVSNDSGRTYSTVYVNSYSTYVVDTVDEKAAAFTDKLGGYVECKADDEAEKVIYQFDNGEAGSIADLKEWDVVSVLRSTTGKYMKVLISTAFAEGKIERVDAEPDEKTVVTIGGVEYKVSNEYVPNSSEYQPALTAGKEGIFSIDVFGNIIGIELSSGEYSYAVLATLQEDTGDEIIYAKIIDQSGVYKKIKLADKVYVDGKACKKDGRGASWMERLVIMLQQGSLFKFDKGATGATWNPNGVYQLIRYTIDDEGKINNIDTTYKGTNESSDSLKILYSGINTTTSAGMTGWYSDGYARFANVFGLNASTAKVIYAPHYKDATNFSAYEVATLSTKWSGSTQYTAIPYGTSYTDALNVPIFVLYDQSASSSYSNYAMVKSIAHKLDDEGEPVSEATVIVDGRETALPSQDMTMFNGVRQGDIIRYKKDINGYATDVIKIFDATSRRVIKLSTLMKDDGTKLYTNIDNTKETETAGGRYLASSTNNSDGSPYVIFTEVYDIPSSSGRFKLNAVFTGMDGAQAKFEIRDDLTTILDSDLTESHGMTNFKCVVFNEENEEVRVGKKDDMRSWKAYRDKCSKVFLTTDMGEQRTLFIYNFED